MEKQPLAVEMHLDDSELTKVLAIPISGKPVKKVINAFYEASRLDQEGKNKEAEKIYIELFNADFDNCVLMAALGMNYALAGKNGIAALLLSTALKNVDQNVIRDFDKLGIKPQNPDDKEAIAAFILTKRAEINNALGTCFKHENKVKEAMAYFQEAQALAGADNADIQNNIGTLYINEGTPDKALEHFERALAVTPDHSQAHWNKSLALLEMGDYEKGWPEYDYGIAAKVRMDRQFTQIPLPVWNGEKNARVVVWGEQGIGDEILFASCLHELMDDSEFVVFDCHKRLHRLFCNSFPGMDIYPTREDEMITWPVNQDGKPRYDFTHRIAIGSLPRHYRPNLDSFPGEPFLKATDASKAHWRAKLDELPQGIPNIGISWVGGHKRTRIEVRSIELEKWLPILEKLNGKANIISLQYTPCETEIEEFEKKYGIKIHHWPEAIYAEDYDQTAGLVSNLDLVLTVCTSLVHLSGALGIPTWVLTPSRPAWRYRLDLDSMPWYSSVVLFRQQSGSTDWNPVIEQVADSIGNLISYQEMISYRGDTNGKAYIGFRCAIQGAYQEIVRTTGDL